MIKSLLLAALIPLVPGFNNVGQSGEIVAVQAATSNEAATVSIKAVQSLTIYTNATAEVIKYEPTWQVRYTRQRPSVAPNTSYTNIVGYVDRDYILEHYNRKEGVYTYKLRDIYRIEDTPITNTVVTARVPMATYTVTNELATVVTSDHFGNTVTNGFLFGGGIVVEGAQDGDTINLLIK